MPINKVTVNSSPEPGDNYRKSSSAALANKTGIYSPPKSPQRKLTGGGVVTIPLMKKSQLQGAGWNAIYSPPNFFSPLHTPQQWQIASKRREIYQWSRHWYENEPKVAAGIDFYAQFPMNGFKLECKNSKIKRYFEKLVKELKLNYWVKFISHEHFLIGDVFPFLEIDCPSCGGSGVDEEGQVCLHRDGKFRRMMILNPDYIEVQKTHIDDRPEVFLIPDEQLKMIVQKKIEPVYSRLSDQIKHCAMNNLPIKLSSRCVSHIAHNKSPYGLYGTPLLRRLFTTLSYKTKLMTANWIVAERLVLPIRVVKVGSDKQQATPEDIVDMQNNLASVAQDPNFTIVTHHAAEFEWIGTDGKIHNIQGDLEYIGKEILDGLMLNQALLNGEMGHYCKSIDTKTLCESGWKFCDEIGPEDKVATFNPETRKIEYHPYEAKHVYEYDGEMVRFHTDKIDALVTPNHRMWSKKRDGTQFEFIRADKVRPRAKFISRVNGFVTEHGDNEMICVGGHTFSHRDFAEFVGYFVSEGYVSEAYKSRDMIAVCQTSGGKVMDKVSQLFDRCFSTSHYGSSSFRTYNPELGEWLHKNCGHGAANKRLPREVSLLSPANLETLLWAMIGGDGTQTNGKTDGRKNANWTYTTVSEKLAEDFVEIAVKCGFTTSMRVEEPCDNRGGHTNAEGKVIQGRLPQYKVLISKGFKGIEPALESKAAETRGKEITREYYKGRVYCFTVPNGLFVTMRNGKVMVTGNSSAQVGVEAILHRLESWRNTLSDWIYEHIFEPTARMQGFIDERATEELQSITEDENDAVYLFPTIKWNDMQLRDKTQQLQLYTQWNQEGKLSNGTLLKMADLDWDEEIEKMRNEQATVGPMGQMQGQGGAGGMGAAGGGAGGAMPMDPSGGAGGGMGMDPSGGMGGGMGMPAGGGAPGAAPMGAAAGGIQKVYKKGNAPKGPNPEDMPPQQGNVYLTKLEAKVNRALQSLQIPFQLYTQFKVQPPGEPQPFRMDFAYPDIRVDIESDGAIWHQNDEKSDDGVRDQKLAAMGWRVLRFKEEAINEHIDAVKQVIYQQVYEAAEERKSQKKKASVNGGEVQVGYHEVFFDGRLMGLVLRHV